jgi:sec-independent protein translocase protein TatA
MLPHLGPTELIIILVIALMIFGAGKLPEVGSALGRGIKEFKKATNDETQREIGASAATTAPTAPVTTASPDTAATASRACAKCGAQTGASSQFCPKCGASLPTAAA